MRRILPFRARNQVDEVFDALSPSEFCDQCHAPLAGNPRFDEYRICPGCGKHFPISPRRRIAFFADLKSFRERDAHLYSTDPLAFFDDESYAERLAVQRIKLGESDALTTGTATIEGLPVVLAVLDFSFMGGSMGVVVGEKLARAAEFAEKKERPLVTVLASGGARMQEGMLSLLQMAKTASAIEQFKSSGGLHLSILTNPTTGGVLASFGSLADIIIAEPASLIGFAGPRVAEQTLGRPLPAGSHTAEFQLEHGLIDAIVDRPSQRAFVYRLLSTLEEGKRSELPELPDAQAPLTATSWERVVAARADDRPTPSDYLARMCQEFVELRGDRQGGNDPAVVTGIGRIDGQPTMIIAFERGHGPSSAERRMGRARPEGYRKAQRAMRMASRLQLPILTMVDTPGAYPGIESEERGLAGEIARTLELMSVVNCPIVSAITGEGGSGGALALAVADRMIMQSGAFFSVIAPEGAAAILYRDPDRAPELADKLRITAEDLVRFGIVDEIVREPAEGAAADPMLASEYLLQAVMTAFDEVTKKRRGRLLKERKARYRNVGSSFVSKSPPKRPNAGPSVSESIPAD